MAITLTLTANTPTPAEADLPVNVALTATAVDSDDPSAIFAFSWHIIDKPPASTAALDDRRNQNPNLNGVDVWGSYRLFCIAQNTTSGVTSEQDPLAAAADSFIDVEVLSENRTLVKPAKSQRNWHTRYWELVDVVEHLEAGMTDATFTTSGAVEIATAPEIATVAGVGDSSSGTSFLAVTTEQLSNVLHSNDANGTLTPGTHNVLRDKVKDAALEKMNEVSITELADVDTTSNPPTVGQVLIWSPTHTDDSGDNDTGAWIPGDATSGGNNPFGVGLCAGETLNTLDFLIYQEDCQEVPVAGAIPGWHARNRYSGETFANNFPFASVGRAGANWHATAEAAGLGLWDDDREAVGQVAIASVYNTARGRGYDADVYSTVSQIQAAQALGQLPAFAMSPLNFAQSLIGTNFTGPNGTITVVTDFNKDGEKIALYDPLYHTAQEIADLVADAAANTTFNGTAVNLIQQTLTTHHILRLGRSSITRLADVDTTTHAPAAGDLLYWDATATDDSGLQQTGAWVPKSLAEIGISGGASSAGSQYEIQLADGSGGFSAANWEINASHHILPDTNEAYDIGSSTKKVRHLYLSDNSLFLGTNSLGADGGTLKWNGTFSIPHYSGTPTDNQILKYSGGSWTLAADGGSGGIDGLTSNSSDTITLDSGYTIIPSADNAQDLGSQTNNFRAVYANEVRGDYSAADQHYAKLKLDAEIPGTPAEGLRTSALYSRGSIAMMIDTNNTGVVSSNSFYVFEGGEDDEETGATERFRVQNDGKVRINDAYYLPTSDGSANRVMTTNGSGQLSFSDVQGLMPQTLHLHHGGTWQEEIGTHITAGSEYSFGVGESPVMMCHKNYSANSMVISDYDVMCTKMMSSTIDFSLVVFTSVQYTSNKATSLDASFQMTRTNSDVNSNDEGLGLNSISGKSLVIPPGSWVGLVMHNYEKAGFDNEHFTWNLRYTLA